MLSDFYIDNGKQPAVKINQNQFNAPKSNECSGVIVPEPDLLHAANLRNKELEKKTTGSYGAFNDTVIKIIFSAYNT